MRKMYLVTENYPNPGGDGIFLRPELNELKKRFEVVIICTSARSAEAVLDEKIRYFFFDLKLPLAKKVGYVLRYMLQKNCRSELKEILAERNGNYAGRVLKSIEFFACGEEFYSFFKKKVCPCKEEDAVFFTFWNRYYSLPLVLRRKQYKKFYLITRLHGCDLFQERYAYGRQPFKTLINERMDKLYFAADLPKEYYCKTFLNVLDSKAEVRRLGVYPINGKKSKAEKEHFLLVSCSNVIPLKRVELIAQALSLIEQPVHWVHFGGGISLENVKKVVNKELPDRGNIVVELRGNTANAEIRRFYEEHYVDCFITTSSTEGGSPVSIMEAMAAGVPVIGTEVGDIPVMIQENGILLDRDPTKERVAEAIKTIMKGSPEVIQRMRENSYRLWQKNYDAFRNAEVFAKSVETLVESRK